MKLPRTGLWLSLALTALVSALACNGGQSAAEDDGRPFVAFVTNCVDPFWFPGRVGAEAAGEELGVRVDVMMPPNGSPEEQKQYVEDLLSSGVDGIAISVIDAANQTSFLNTVAAKVPVVTHDSDAPESDRRCFIGVDNYRAGLMCGELVREAIPNGGKIVLFIGNLSQDNAVRRRQGVIDAVLGREPDPKRRDPIGQELRDPSGKYVILRTLTDQTDQQKAKANAEDAMNANPDLACMVGLFNSNAPMCLQAARQAGKLGKIAIVGFDEHEDTLQGILDGHIRGTVVQDPYRYGHESVARLKRILDGDASAVPDDGFVHIEARRIDKSNVEAFWADLKQKLAAGNK